MSYTLEVAKLVEKLVPIATYPSPFSPGPLIVPRDMDPHFVLNTAEQPSFSNTLKKQGGSPTTPPKWKPDLEKLKDQSFSIVDLSSNTSTPTYLGWRDTKPRDIASLGKLLPLYGAFQLRADVIWAFHFLDDGLSTPSLGGVAEFLREYYCRGTNKGSWRALKRPRIEELFTVRKMGTLEASIEANAVASNRLLNGRLVKYDVQFKRLGLSNVELDKYYCENSLGLPRVQRMRASWPRVHKQNLDLDCELNTLYFEELLRLMVGWSDNTAAAIVIQALSFEYLFSLSKAAAFYGTTWPDITDVDAHSKSETGGLVLKGDYSDYPPLANYSTTPPIPFKCGYWRSPPSFVCPGRAASGTARSVASLVTLLAQDTLLDDRPSIPSAPAFGLIDFSSQPVPASAISVAGTQWKFVTGLAVGAQTQIEGDLEATVTALAKDLNASQDLSVGCYKYTAHSRSLRVEEKAMEDLSCKFFGEMLRKDRADFTGDLLHRERSPIGQGMYAASPDTVLEADRFRSNQPIISFGALPRWNPDYDLAVSKIGIGGGVHNVLLVQNYSPTVTSGAPPKRIRLVVVGISPDGVHLEFFGMIALGIITKKYGLNYPWAYWIFI